MNEKELYDKIEAYLREDLSAADKKAFDAEIASNPQLAEQVEMHRFEWDGMEVILENDLRAKMAQWQEEGKQASFTPSVSEAKNRIIPIEKGKTTVRRLYYGLAIAASLTLLLGVLLWVFTKPTPASDVVKNDASKDTIARLPLPTPMPKSDKENTPIVQMDKKPFETPAIPPKLENPTPIVPNNETNRVDETTLIAFAEDAYKEDVPDYESINTSRGGNNTSVLDEAGKAYDSKDFTKVISLLKNTLALDENYSALELLAHSYFQQKQYKLALPLFKDLLRLSGKRTHDKSEWYLLLCYLTNYSHYKSEFNVLSQKISANTEHDYTAQTKTLLSKMSKK